MRSEGAIALAAVIREGLPILKVSPPSQFSLSCLSVSAPSDHCCVPCLQELNLSFGEITEAAALVVAQAVTDKPHMEKVDLNGTNTDSETGLTSSHMWGSHKCTYSQNVGYYN